MAVVVFGSINMDVVVRLPRFPNPGETLFGHSFFTAPGGKGANQAVAAARLGAMTRLIGQVGADAFGATLLATLQVDKIDIAGVISQPGQSSGVAFISVDDRAENRIIVVPGANASIGAAHLARLDAALDGAHVLLLQLEVPLAMVVEAARLARQRGVLVVLDPAPAQTLPTELYALTDILTPNQVEAAMLVGHPVESDADVAQAAQTLLERGVSIVVIKLANKGVYWTDGITAQFVPAFRVVAVDTIAAGDAFNGALAAALAEKQPAHTAISWGMAAGALAVTKSGAQPALPDRTAVMLLLNQALPQPI
ncbi:MAG: ribokinase [Herpetosiphonaceae bacterium]|nr:ribokinase [Herpetosiphonaceae bacterium]